MSIAPTPRALLAFAVGLPLSLLPALVEPRLLPLWPAALVVVGVACLLDVLLTPSARHLATELDAPDALYLGDADPFRVRLTLGSWIRPVDVELLSELTPPFAADTARVVRLTPSTPLDMAVPLRPTRRGQGHITALWLRLTGPLGLMRRSVRRPVGHLISIVPDVRAVRAAALRLSQEREYLAGLKVVHHLGDGTEFDQLRDFVPGLDHRSMNWKHSARHGKLICTQHRAERNHQVVLALDTGHLMGEPIEGLPKLDHAINAALLLAYYGLRAGDRVGLFAFDDAVRLFVPPGGGVHHFARLQHHTAALAYGAAETNFTLGLTSLSRKLARRTLIVVLTDFVDTTTALLMAENLRALGRRHLVVFASLVDPALLALLRAAPDGVSNRTDPLAMHRAVVADDLLRERETVLKTITRAGIQAIDTTPQKLSTDLINRYLDIRRREMVG